MGHSIPRRRRRNSSPPTGALSDESTPAPEWGPQLTRASRAAARARHLARRTEQADRGWVRRFLAWTHWRHPLTLGARDAASFLSDLATRAKVSASTQDQALAALLFLFRDVMGQDLPWLDDLIQAPIRRRIPVVLTRSEVRRLLSQLEGTPRDVASLLYGEALRLRIKDVDLEAASSPSVPARETEIAVPSSPQHPSPRSAITSDRAWPSKPKTSNRTRAG